MNTKDTIIQTNNGISAKVIADSINEQGKRITTFELEYPRFVHAEVMTHRMLSRNSASSRAIPISKMIELVLSNTAKPVHWGMNQPGMQASEEADENTTTLAKEKWMQAMQQAVQYAQDLSKLGIHKQVVNRLLEPFQQIKVILTATELKNFFALRDHKDAQPEIKELAVKMLCTLKDSSPRELAYGMWHLPYVESKIEQGEQVFFSNGEQLTESQAIKVSCSSAAQVSYRKLDTTLEKAEQIYQKLVESKPVHASAMEHAALCFDQKQPHPGWTHYDNQHKVWSGNFHGWIQYRQLIKNNVVHG